MISLTKVSPFLALTAACGFTSCTSENDSGELPNIILITADDMGQDMGLFDDPNAYTPNLDDFGRSNVFFRNGYVTTASCSPSRSAMLTGLYPFQNGQIGLSHRGFEMNAPYENMFSILHEQGYATGILGKLHVKPFSAFPNDYSVSIDFPKPWRPEAAYNKDSLNVITTGGKSMQEKIKYSQAIRSVADSANYFFEEFGDKPLFMMINLLDPHHPFYDQIDGFPNDPVINDDIKDLRYFEEDTPENREKVSGYYNGIARVDTAFAMIIQALKDHHEYDNSLIIFIGDHGAPFSRSKMTCYEKGLRIPFLVKFPGNKYSGTYSQDVQTIDILPTVLDMLNLPGEDELPGISLYDIVQGEDRHEFILGEFNIHTPWVINPVRSYKKGDYKLLVNYLSGYYKMLDPENFKSEISGSIRKYAAKPELELYNLQEDPEEMNNLAYDPEYSQKLQELREELRDVGREYGDTLVSGDLGYFKKKIEEFRKK